MQGTITLLPACNSAFSTSKGEADGDKQELENLSSMSSEDKGAAVGPCAPAGTSGVVSKAKQKIRKFRIRATGIFSPHTLR